MNDDDDESADLTGMLRRAGPGDADATERVARAVDSELRRVAEAYLRRERPGHVLDAPALVNEAWVSLLPLVQGKDDWPNRRAFYAAAAKTMRHVLVDAARARDTRKRGGGHTRVDFEIVAGGLFASPLDQDGLLDLDEALEAFAEVDERAARAVELKVFGGLTVREIAGVQGCAASTVDMDLTLARAWLTKRLE